MGMKRVVVTGATGLIGRYVTQALSKDWEVHAISRLGSSTATTTGVQWHEIDLSRKLPDRALPSQIDAVIYLAQSEYFREFPRRALDIFEVNTANVLRFLDYAKVSGARTFVFASSGGVYGGGDSRMSEEVPIPARGDLGFYLTTKLCSEIAAQNYTEHFNVVILRYFFVYGPSQRQSMLIPRLIHRVRTGQSILLQGEEGIRLNPIHVIDAAAATVQGLKLEGSYTINVAGPDVLTMREIGIKIGQAVAREPVFLTDMSAGPRHLTGDITRMRELLIAPQIGFSEGMRSMVTAESTR